jgi:ABC-2 type transport system ATP-binding protein
MGSIRTDELTVRYGKARGIDQISLHVETSEVLGLLGPNGAGKTTWLRAVLDLVHPTSGTAAICGVDSRDARSRAAVTYLPGDLKLPPRLTGWQVLRRFTAGRANFDEHETRALGDRLGVQLDRKIGALSKGNRQKIGLILALAPKTPVLLLDEPTSGLDPLIQQTFVEMIRERAASGVCVVLSSHVLSELEHLADRVAVLRQGACVAVESITELRQRTRIEWLAVLEDEPAAERVAQQLASDDSVQVQRFGGEIHAVLRGSVNPLIRVLAQENVIRLEERSGELEDLLREYYNDPQATP